MPNKLSVAESRVLESIQGAAFDVPGVLPTARGLSHWGEHALGWMGSAAVGAGVDKRRREGWIRVGAAAFLAHAASVVLKRIVRRKRPDHPYITVGVGTARATGVRLLSCATPVMTRPPKPFCAAGTLAVTVTRRAPDSGRR